MHKRLALVCMAPLILSACAPGFQFTQADLEHRQLPQEVVIVVDYLAVTDDVGQLWDYKEEKNVDNIRRFG